MTFGPDGLIYMSCCDSSAIYVYNSRGRQQHISQINFFDLPLGFAFDSDDNLHVCFSVKIKVFNIHGHMLREYALNTVSNPRCLAIHPSGFKFVLLENDSIAVYDNEYQHLYSICVKYRKILDIAVTPDGIVWICYVSLSVERRKELIRLPFSIAFRPPPPLSLLCQSTILLHLAELPASLLPPRYAKRLESWSKLVDVEVIETNQVSNTFKMRIKPLMSNVDIMEFLLESPIIPNHPGTTKSISIYEQFAVNTVTYIVQRVKEECL